MPGGELALPQRPKVSSIAHVPAGRAAAKELRDLGHLARVSVEGVVEAPPVPEKCQNKCVDGNLAANDNTRRLQLMKEADSGPASPASMGHTKVD